MRGLIYALAIMAAAAPVIAKDRLGVFQSWAAFRDPATPRCYAIAAPEKIAGVPTHKAFLSVGYWPKKGATGQVYTSLSRERSANSSITLTAGGRRFRLTAAALGGWAVDRRMDQAIIAAMRSASALSIESIGRDGRPIVDAYSLRGAPSAVDAAALGCAG
jgi:hypothetical protein